MCSHKTRTLYQLEDKVERHRENKDIKTIKEDKSKRSNIQLEGILERKEKKQMKEIKK